MTAPKTDLPQGTLDLLILKVVALGSVHGYAIVQRLEQVSRGVVQVPEGSLYPALHKGSNVRPGRFTIGANWLRLVRSHPQFCETDEPEKRCIGSGIPAVSRFVLRHRLRAGDRRNVADSRCAGR